MNSNSCVDTTTIGEEPKIREAAVHESEWRKVAHAPESQLRSMVRSKIAAANVYLPSFDWASRTSD